jgi:16S rRNA C967 or C1407 C5-methylase (RsmB/RsmF family)
MAAEQAGRAGPRLPAEFIAELQAVFTRFGMADEWAMFLAALAEPPWHGLRANALKITPTALAGLIETSVGAPLQRVIWSDDGFYISDRLQPGKWPAYAAGLYYIQEPSAMLPACVLAVKPGERVLDLCAAPGGKSVRLAADLRGQGLLWANEIAADRVRALLRNLELAGCTGCVITQETPERLSAALPGFFDAILVDAPCSGAGMFRRDPQAVRSYQAYGPAACARLQRSILEAAWQMLGPGGRLVYSTCTFSLIENEGLIADFCRDHTDCRIMPIAKAEGVSDGLPLTPELTRTARIWPHRTRGEGHFCALLIRSGVAVRPVRAPYVCETGPDGAWQVWDDFCRQTLTTAGLAWLASCLAGSRRRFERDRLHLVPAACPMALASLQKVKTGLFLGQVKSLRAGGFVFEPAQAFLLGLPAGAVRSRTGGDGQSDLVRRYLRGETVLLPDDHAETDWPAGRYGALVLRGSGGEWPLGWVKCGSLPHLKNLYPPGWRSLT